MRPGVYWKRTEDRLVEWVERALRRKPSAEAVTAGAVREAARHSKKLQKALVHATDVLASRGAFQRPLYQAAVGALAETKERRLGPLLVEAMQQSDAGSLATIAASRECRSKRIDDALVRAAACRHPEIAFAAVLVHRMRAGGGKGLAMMSAVARMKESSRIDLCTHLLAPLMMAEVPALPSPVGGGLRALRDAERHLGRWLVLARAGLKSGDVSALEEADRRRRHGSSSAQAAWSLMRWALLPGETAPEVRPTAEIVFRLSDRPTSERDTSFLFHLAEAQAEGARGLLESMSHRPLRRATAVRAAGALARCYDAKAALGDLREVADGRRGPLAGLAVAALHDAGEHAEARHRAAELSEARSLPTSVWGGLVLSAAGQPVISETSFRRLERGWML
ncbi:MAG: hypothetical protein KC731_03765 [Myxococcales bacterium]|nr:hypothetical protein [Myxococcales bacterium]